MVCLDIHPWAEVFQALFGCKWFGVACMFLPEQKLSVEIWCLSQRVWTSIVSRSTMATFLMGALERHLSTSQPMPPTPTTRTAILDSFSWWFGNSSLNLFHYIIKFKNRSINFVLKLNIFINSKWRGTWPWAASKKETSKPSPLFLIRPCSNI